MKATDIRNTGIAALAAVLVYGWCSAATAEVSLGDARDRVLAELGTPKGYLKGSAREVWLYERGRIVFEHGAVSEVALVSEAEARRLAVEREAESRRLAAERQAAALVRQEEGRRQLEAALADEALKALPARERLAYWGDFRRRYPDTDIGAAYLEAQAAYRREVDEDQQKQQLADLERRVAAAEERARAAERKAAERPTYMGYSYSLPTAGTRYGYRYSCPTTTAVQQPWASLSGTYPPLGGSLVDLSFRSHLTASDRRLHVRWPDSHRLTQPGVPGTRPWPGHAAGPKSR